MRAIDGDALIDKYGDWYTEEGTEEGYIGTIKGIVDSMPTIEPEIIYCKDCKFYSPMNRETKTGICNLTMHQNFGDNWFCAGAERRTNEQIRGFGL